MTDLRDKANFAALDTIDAVEGFASLPFIEGLIAGMTDDEIIAARRTKREAEKADRLAKMRAYYK